MIKIVILPLVSLINPEVILMSTVQSALIVMDIPRRQIKNE